jgi:hypothetical protein
MSVLGSFSDVERRPSHVRRHPNNGHAATASACPFCANNGSRTIKNRQNKKPHEGGSQFKPDVLNHAAINAGLDFRR